ncbi:hypothetical protein MRX96_011546 [Rhipicephalus microplus]
MQGFAAKVRRSSSSLMEDAQRMMFGSRPHREVDSVDMQGGVKIRRLGKHKTTKEHATERAIEYKKTRHPSAQHRVPEKQKSFDEQLKRLKKKKKDKAAKVLKPKKISPTTEEPNEPGQGFKTER